jgi:hypothetical protein
LTGLKRILRKNDIAPIFGAATLDAEAAQNEPGGN